MAVTGFVDDRWLLARARDGQEHLRTNQMEIGDWLGPVGNVVGRAARPVLVLVISPDHPAADQVFNTWGLLAERLKSTDPTLAIEVLVIGGESEAGEKYPAIRVAHRVSRVTDIAEFKARVGITAVPFTVLLDSR